MKTDGNAPRRGMPRTAAIVAVLTACLLFIVSYFAPWWRFWLYAPQYPGGLRLIISLNGMSGDVSEIDLLNHYIGMGHLASAAPVERQMAAAGVAVVAALTFSGAVFTKRRWAALAALPAVAFPVAFVVDSFYWLYTFGHRLDPHAPLRIGTFTPQLFGNGQIGQFETFARPAAGFWLAVAGVAFALAAAYLRLRTPAPREAG